MARKRTFSNHYWKVISEKEAIDIVNYHPPNSLFLSSMCPYKDFILSNSTVITIISTIFNSDFLPGNHIIIINWNGRFKVFNQFKILKIWSQCQVSHSAFSNHNSWVINQVINLMGLLLGYIAQRGVILAPFVRGASTKITYSTISYS